MNKGISEIRDKLHGGNNRKGKQLTESDIPELHHRFMTVYGWIPMKEFMDMPISMLLMLIPKVDEEYKEKKEVHQAIMALAGVKRK